MTFFGKMNRRHQALVLISWMVFCIYSTTAQTPIENCELETISNIDDPSQKTCTFCQGSTAGKDLVNWGQCVLNTSPGSTPELWRTTGCLSYVSSPLSTTSALRMDCSKCDCKKTLDISGANFACKDSTIQHCAKSKVVSGTEKCEMCRHGSDHGLPWEDYGLKSDLLECFNNKADGKFPHCERYTATDPPKCEKCHWGWILNNDATATGANVCLPIPDSQIQTQFDKTCLQASLQTGSATLLKCNVCIDANHRINEAGTECSAAVIPGCASGSQSKSDVCDKCDTGFFASPTSKNICQQIANCTTQTVFGKCDTCDSGYYGNGTSSCLQKILDASCTNLETQEQECTCTAPQILTWDGKMCVNNPGNVSNCIKLSPSGAGCGKCSDETTYILTVSDDMSKWECKTRPTNENRIDANCFVAYASFDVNDANQITHCRMCKYPWTAHTEQTDAWGNKYWSNWNEHLKLAEDFKCYSRVNLGYGCPLWAVKSDYECQFCNEGFYPTANKQCLPLPKEIKEVSPACNQIGPVSTSDPQVVCQGCKDGYILQDDQTCKHKSTIIDKCSHYMTDGLSCMHCLDGYTKSTDGKKCIKEIKYCIQYDENTSTAADSTCQQCMVCHGQALSADGQWCVDVPSHGCEQVDASGNNCIRCANKRRNGWTYDFYLNANQCEQNLSKVPNCKRYNGNTCTECHAGATRIPTDTNLAITSCSRDIPNCIFWEQDSDANNQFLCNQCDTGSTLSTSKLTCQSGITNCQKTLPGTTDRCIECQLNYYLKAGYQNTDRSATECFNIAIAPTTTNRCFAVDTNNKCIQCETGKTLSTGQIDCITIQNCSEHIETEENGCRICKAGFRLENYDSAQDFGTSCVSETSFSKDIQNTNKLGKHSDNYCAAFFSDGKCAKCIDDWAIDNSTNPPKCTQPISNCQIYAFQGNTAKCAVCKANYAVTGWDANLKFGTACASSTGNVGADCLVSDGATTSPKCLVCNKNKLLSGSGTCDSLPNGCTESEGSVVGQCNKCGSGFVMRHDDTKTYGECISTSTADTLTSSGSEKNIDKDVYNRVPNCSQYDDTNNASKCQACATGFKLDKTDPNKPMCSVATEISNCVQHNADYTKCRKCSTGYFLTNYNAGTMVGDACSNTSPKTGCAAEDNTNQCVLCSDNFNLQADDSCEICDFATQVTRDYVGGKGTCGDKPAEIVGCIGYHSNGKCIKAATTHTLPTDGAAAGYTALITLTDCEIHYETENQGCQKCVPGKIKQDKSCVATITAPITDCQEYDANQKCVKCITDQKPDGTMANCVDAIPDQQPNCQTHNNDYTKCLECNTGYFLTGYDAPTMTGTGCSNTTPKTNCLAEDANSKCAKCADGMQPATDGLTCVASTTTGCSQFNGDYTKCVKCTVATEVVKNYELGVGTNKAVCGKLQIDGCVAYNTALLCMKSAQTYTLPTDGSNTSGYAALQTIAFCDTHYANEDMGCWLCKTTPVNYNVAGKLCVTDGDLTSQINTAYAASLRPANCVGFNRASGQCTKCDSAKKPNTDTAPTCIDGTIQNCQIYNANFDQCWQCKATFILTGFVKADDTGTACADNSTNGIANCEAQDANNKCVRCASGFTIKAADGSCTADTNLNCQAYSQTEVEKCTACLDATYFLKYASTVISPFGACQSRDSTDTEVDTVYSPFVQNCVAYQTDFKCGQCSPSLSLNTANSMCETSTNNCREHTGTTCNQCFYGYKIDANAANNKCIAETTGGSSSSSGTVISQCINHSTTAGKCQKCHEVFQLTANRDQCIYTTLAQCQTRVEGDAVNCDTCIGGYVQSGTPAVCNKCALNQSIVNGACTTTKKIENCATSDNQFATCKTCDANFLPIWSRTACQTPIITNCDVLTEDGALCAVCKSKFVRSSLENLGQAGAEVGKMCHAEVTNCVTYDANGVCTKCFEPAYYLQDSASDPTKKICEPANVNWCVENQTDDVNCPQCCNKCAPGFGLFAWTEGTITKHSCVYNSLTCAVPNCIKYKSFNDWQASECETVDTPVTPGPTSGNTSGSPSVSISITPKDTVSSNILAFVAGLFVLIALQLVSF